MKKYFMNPGLIKGLFIISLLSFIACQEEFLDITPNHYLTEGDFYQTEEDFEQAVIAVYGDLQKYVLDAHFLQEGRSDNTTYDNQLDQGALGGFAQWGFMDQFIMSPDANLISNAWNLIFGAIKDCNVPLYYLESAEIDENVAKQVEAELKFFRAYFHFVAVRYWGDVPLLLKPVTTAEEAFAISRSPVDSVYESIIRDAEFAATILPPNYSENNTGKVTKGAAKMLLAKVYMTRHEYALAEDELTEIMELDQYDLLENYGDIFDPLNKNHEESIFEVQFKEGSEGESSNFMYQFAPVGSRGTVVVGPHTGNSGGRNIPTLDMIDAYEPNDLRKEISIGYFNRNPDPLHYVKKFDHDSDPDFARTPDNWPIYRYADALLLLAEAINEQAYQNQKPFELLNRVRDRTTLPPLTPVDLPDQESFRAAIAQERRVELAFENHRWFDLLRTGKAIEVMTAYGIKEMANPTLPPPDFLPFTSNSFKVTQEKLLYPIPSDELNKNPNMAPNPGY